MVLGPFLSYVKPGYYGIPDYPRILSWATRGPELPHDWRETGSEVGAVTTSGNVYPVHECAACGTRVWRGISDSLDVALDLCGVRGGTCAEDLVSSVMTS